MSENRPFLPVPIEDELAIIGELGGVSPDELAGLRTEPAGFAVDQGVFDQEEHLDIVPITEELRPAEPKYPQESVMSPTEDDLQQGFTLLEKAKNSKAEYATIIERLDNLSSAMVRDTVTSEIGLLLAPSLGDLGTPDYITYFRNMHAVVATCNHAQVKATLTRAIYEGQRAAIVVGRDAAQHNDYHLTVKQVEILSLEIHNDRIREELILDIMNGQITEGEAHDLVKHLGHVFDSDLVAQEWQHHRFSSDKNQGILEEKRDKCLLPTALPTTSYPKPEDVDSAFESVRNVRQGNLRTALSSLDVVQHQTLQEIVLACVIKKRSDATINPNEFASEFAGWFSNIDAMNNRSLADVLQTHANEWQVTSLRRALHDNGISWAQAELSSYTIKDDERRETFILDMLADAKDYETAVAVCQRHIGNFYDRSTILDALAHQHFQDNVTARFSIQPSTKNEAQATRQRNE